MCYFFYIFVTMLELKIESCRKKCESLTIKDITGFWSLTNEGWGTPNPEKSDVESSILKIITPSGSIIEEDVTEIIQDSVFSSYKLFEISELEDGVYSIELIINTESEEFKTSITHRVYCNVECCVDKLSYEVSKDDCVPCNSSKTDKYLLAFTLLSALKSECLSNEEFKKILARLKKICETGDCGCGC